MTKMKLVGVRSRDQRGYTLLEYCAGAAILAVTVWGALVTLGGSMTTYLGSVGGWLNARGQEVRGAQAQGG